MTHLIRFLVALMLSAANASSLGDPSCPCVEWADIERFRTQYQGERCLLYSPSNGAVASATSLDAESDAYCYPENYGSSQCQVWDVDLGPYCADADGAALEGRPSWCSDSWCYVDPNHCDLAKSRSGFFGSEEVYYSYATCGSKNSFAEWAENPQPELEDLLGKVAAYLRTTQRAIEVAHNELRDVELNEAYCSLGGTCDCQACAAQDGWGCEAEVGFENAQGVYGCTGQPSTCVDKNAPQTKRMMCMGRDIAETYLRVAAKEYNDRSRVAYQYYGDQATGVMVQWPELSWCPSGAPPTFDPRFRPWYSVGASGGKDVVLVLDKSGSMNSNDRIDLAKEAALAVIDTLTWADFANVILFDIYALSFRPNLTQMTADNKRELKAWVEDQYRASGGTFFRAGFEAAFETLPPRSSQCSNCNMVVLFMTDGVDESFGAADQAWLRAEVAARGCLSLMTYAFGAGVSSSARAKVKTMACEGSGIFHLVQDGVGIRDTMASYFNLIASGIGATFPAPVRWVLYNDAYTNEELLAGCIAAFDRDAQPPQLLGVTCMDMNMIASIEKLREQAGWGEFVTDFTEATTACSPVALSEAEPVNLHGFLCADHSLRRLD